MIPTMWGFYGVAWWWVLLGAICMVLFWGVVIWLVVWGTRQVSRDRAQKASAKETPLEIAQQRLARGEITREEYDKMRETLRH